MTTRGLVLPMRLGAVCWCERRNWAANVWRALVCCALWSIIFLPEFSGVSGESSISYAEAIAGFRYLDIILLTMATCHLIALGCVRRKPISFPRQLAVPGLAFLACIPIGITHGWLHGGSNFFFDWRALALGIGTYAIWSYWLQDDPRFVIRIFALYMSGRILWLYLAYALGRGDSLLGTSIPVFDGPTISSIVFMGLLAFAMQDGTSRGHERLIWSFLAGSAALMVLLCMRRTYWVELAMGVLLLMLVRKRHRLQRLTVVLLAVLVGVGFLGQTFVARLRSFDVNQSEVTFSADNADHLNDLVDAWEQVKQAPILGIGVGVSYPTWHTRNWKADSVMVHNAPLHVWIKYGLVGLACYLWFHLALLRWLFQRSRTANGASGALLAAAFAYMAAQFVVTLGFAPWPYSELQLTTLTSFILAASVTAVQQQSCRFRHDTSFSLHHHAFL